MNRGQATILVTASGECQARDLRNGQNVALFSSGSVPRRFHCGCFVAEVLGARGYPQCTRPCS